MKWLKLTVEVEEVEVEGVGGMEVVEEEGMDMAVVEGMEVVEGMDTEEVEGMDMVAVDVMVMVVDTEAGAGGTADGLGVDGITLGIIGKVITPGIIQVS